MKNPKLYVIEKFVWASSVADALKQEKKQAASNVYLDPDWRKNHTKYENS
jgi:hypothetical protein